MANELSLTINQLLDVTERSVSEVARLGGLDRSYVLRLSSGKRVAPSGSSLARLWQGFIMEPELMKRDPTLVHGLDRLLLAALIEDAKRKASEE